MAENYDVVVIGSGPGGYVAAIRCSQLGLKTACVEKDKVLGGTCLNVGCIPSKALLQSSELYFKLAHSRQKHGIETGSLSVNLNQMMERKTGIVSGFNQGIQALFKKNKITPITGLATFSSPTTISVEDKEITASNFIIATGSEPISLPFLPLDEKRLVSSTGALSLDKIPQKMLVIGAGIIGVELGSVYSRLGADVEFIEFLDHICPTLDGGISKEFKKILTKQGLKFNLSSKVVDAKINKDSIALTVEKQDGNQETFTGDIVLVSIGRRPYTEGLGLDKINIEPNQKGFIPINGRFQTNHSHIYAIGDIVDGPMLAHKASEEGIAVAEIIAGEKPKIEYMGIPSVVYTDPEVAGVGLTEEEAKNKGLNVKIGQFPFKANSRARCSGDDEGFVKMIVEESTGIVVGLHILGPHAGELIEEGCLAIEKKATALEIANTSHAHPTFSEAIKEAALMIAKKAIHI